MNGYVDPNLGQWSRTNRLLADAAARAGATVEELTDVHTDALVALCRGDKRVIVAKTRSPFLTAVANKLANNKYTSGVVLRRAGLPTVERLLVEDLSAGEQRAAARAALARWGTVVVKPNWGNRALGVTKGVTTWSSLTRAVRVAVGVDEDEEALIEPELTGVNLRISVIGGVAVAACVIERPVLIGDGVTTLREQITVLNTDPRRGYGWRAERPTPIDLVEPDSTWAATLRARGLSLERPLPPGVSVEVLPEEAETIDVTDVLHPNLANIATRACSALGVDVGGVDLIVPHPSESAGVLLEVNCLPALHLHALPTRGQPRPVFDAFVAWCLQ